MYTASIESWIEWGLKLFPWIFLKYFLNCNAVAIVPSPTGSENICLTGLKPQAMVIDHQEFHATNCMGGFSFFSLHYRLMFPFVCFTSVTEPPPLRRLRISPCFWRWLRLMLRLLLRLQLQYFFKSPKRQNLINFMIHKINLPHYRSTLTNITI